MTRIERWLNGWGLILSMALLLTAMPVPYAFAASNSGITYHGRILKPDGSPLESAQVQFKIQIRSPGNENCLMYEEVQTRNMANSSGVFAITLNDGSGTRTDSNSYSIDDIFANRGSFSFASGACATGLAYNTNASDGRQLVMYFRSDSMAQWEQLPAQAVNFAPMALEAKQVGGYRPSNLLRVDDTAAASNTTLLNSTQLTSLFSLVNGTSTQYVKTSSSAGATMPSINGAPATLTSGSMWFDTSTNELKYYNGTGVMTVGAGGGGSGTVTGITVGTGLVDGTGATGTVISTAGTIALPNVGSAGTYVKVTTDAQGRVSSGVAALVEGDIPTLTAAGKVSGGAITSGTISGTTAISTSGNLQTSGDITAKRVFVQDNGSNYAGLQAPAAVTSTYTLTLPSALPLSAGQVLASDTSGNLSWVTPSAGSVTSVGVTAPITNTGTTSAPVIAISQANGTTNGYLSSSDWTTFNSKLGTSLASGNIWVGSVGGTATAVAPSGDVTMTTAGGFTVTQIRGVAVSATAPTTAGQVLRYDGTSSYVPAALGVADITGLSTALSNKLDASNMPANCSANQTLTFSSPTGTWACSNIAITGSAFGSQAQNLVLASPDGSAGNPTFRSLAAGDIPSLDTAKIASGTLGVARGGTGSSDGSITGTSALTFAAGGSNQNVTLTPSGTGSTVLGGKVGVGTASPAVSLDLSSRTDALALPKGTVAEQPGTPSAGWVRYNTDNNAVEFYNGSAWTTLAASGGSYLSTAGGTLTGTLTISSGGASITGGIDNNSGGITEAGSITGVGANITGAGAMTVAAGGTAQNLTLSSSTTGSVNVGSGNGTSLQVQDGGVGTVNYVTVQGSATGAAPTIGTAGGDANIDLKISPKGSGNTVVTNGNVGIGTTAPVAPLQVDGPTTVTAAASIIRGGDDSSAIWKNAIALNHKPDTTIVSGSSIGIGLAPLASTGSIYYGAAAIKAVRENSTADNQDTALAFYTRAGASNVTTNTEKMRITSTGNIGIGTTSPGAMLDVNGEIRMRGATSGYVGLKAPATAPDVVWTLPTADSTGTQFLQSDGAGNLSWGSPAGSGTVNSGTQNQLAYYGANGTAVSGLATANNGVLATNASGVPSIGSTLPTAVQGNITSLGTITSGTWNGSIVGAQYGGTGVNASAAANGQLLIGNGTGFTLAGLTGTANQVSVTTGAGSITLSAPQDIHSGASPTFAGLTLSGMSSAGIVKNNASGVLSGGNTVSLTADVGGTLPVANGGTGINTYATGDLLYASAANTLSKLPAGTNGHVLTLSGGVPSWQATAASLTNWTEALSTAAPNATVPVVSLSATNGATNVDLALAPKGSGAISAHIADNTATGGNKRGTYAVDWQRNRSSSTQIASGTNSVISGGRNNTASGTDAIIAGGYLNTASGTWGSTISGGWQNTASGSYSSVTGGIMNTAAGENSLASNTQTSADSFAQSTFGRYNRSTGVESATTWVATDPLFVVGNGSSSAAKSNALTVLKNGNVGIGIHSTSNALAVSPLQYLTGLASQSSNTVTGAGTSWNAGMVGMQLVFANGTSAGTITGFNSPTSLTVSTSQTVGIQGYGIHSIGLNVTPSGNVGIGTTTPAVTLDLSAKTDALALPKGTTAEQPGTPQSGWIRYNTTDNAVEFHNGTTWTTLATGGGSYLSASGGTISGNLTISSGGATITGGVDNNSGGITNAGSITGVGTNITGSGAMTVASGGTNTNLSLSSNGTGSVNIGSTNGTSLSILDGGAGTVNYITVKGSTTGAATQIANTGTDADISLAIMPKGAGNVGIGTTSATALLHVSANQNAATRFRLTNTTAGTGAFSQASVSSDASSVNSYAFSSGYSTSGRYIASGALLESAGAGGLGVSASAGDLMFYTNAGSERMRIDASGNVGIGTASPAAALDVTTTNTTLLRLSSSGANGTTTTFSN